MKKIIFYLLASLAPGPAWTKTTPPPAPERASSTELPLLAPATAPITLGSVLERLENFDKRMTSLTADFEEIIRMGEDAPLQTVSGSIEYSKPTLLRIEHRSPQRQTVVCDGKYLWVWRRETNQVIQSNLEDWKKSTLESFLLVGLSSTAELSKRYEMSLADISAPGPDGHRRLVLELKPKEKRADFRLRLMLTTRNFFPSEIELKTGELLLTSTLSRVRLNAQISTQNFKFSTPPGSEVFNNFRFPAMP